MAEGQIKDKMNTIDKMKKQVEKLDDESDFEDVMSSPERSPVKVEYDDNGNEKKKKRKKTKMCKEFMEKGVC